MDNKYIILIGLLFVIIIMSFISLVHYMSGNKQIEVYTYSPNFIIYPEELNNQFNLSLVNGLLHIACGYSNKHNPDCYIRNSIRIKDFIHEEDITLEQYDIIKNKWASRGLK